MFRKELARCCKKLARAVGIARRAQSYAVGHGFRGDSQEQASFSGRKGVDVADDQAQHREVLGARWRLCSNPLGNDRYHLLG